MAESTNIPRPAAGQILDAMREMSTVTSELQTATAGYFAAAHKLLNVLGTATDAYQAGYDAGVCAAMEVNIEGVR